MFTVSADKLTLLWDLNCVSDNSFKVFLVKFSLDFPVQFNDIPGQT
jgi:hypothetical protein